MGDLAGVGSLVVFLLGLPQLYVSLVGLAAPATCTCRSKALSLATACCGINISHITGQTGSLRLVETKALLLVCIRRAAAAVHQAGPRQQHVHCQCLWLALSKF